MTDGLRVLDQLLHVTALLNDDMSRSLQPMGLTMSRTHLLWELQRLGPSTQQALASALAVSPRNVTGLVDALESSGFVSRGAHPTDRRATLVSLTDLGTTTMTTMERQRIELAEQLVAGLDQPTLTGLTEGLDLVTERLASLVSAADPAHSAAR